MTLMEAKEGEEYIIKDIMKAVSGMKIVLAMVFGIVGGIVVKILLNLSGTGWSLEIQSFIMLAASACMFFGVYGVALLVMKEEFVWELLESVIRRK